MDIGIGDKVELVNGNIVEITFVGETINNEVVYGTGTNPIIVVFLENITKKI